MNVKISKFREFDKGIILSLFLILSLLPSLVLAATDTVTINVNVSISAVIEVSPDTATFNLVTPGVDTFPGSLAFTITNKGSTNFTQMYVSIDVPSQETSNPLSTGNPSAYYAGGFVVLKNETDLAGGNDWKFIGRQEWNLTEKPSDYTPATWAKGWGYFGNNSKRYFWDLTNGTDGTCNQTGTALRIKNWGVNGTAAAYDLSSEATSYTFSSAQEDWGILNVETGGPMADYCVAARTDCKRIFIYQWDQTSPFDQCSGEWYLWNDGDFTPDDQFKFNITVWVPYGIPAGDTSSSTLTVTAS